MKTTRANKEEDDFLKDCQTNTTCGGIVIKYPFRLESRPPYCGVQGLDVSCSSSGDAVLTLPKIGSCKLINIDYDHGYFTIKLGESWPPCPLQKLIATNFTNTIYDYIHAMDFNVVSCSREIQTDPDWIAGPISCLGRGKDRLVYVVIAWVPMENLPRGCETTGAGGLILVNNSWGEALQSFIQTRQMLLSLIVPEMDACRHCRWQGDECGFSQARNHTICISSRHGPNVKIIVGISATGFVLFVLAAILLVMYILKKSKNDQETHLKVEKFLATYDDVKPTRYTFADIKKITKRFKNKLGQGGYGCVYKGVLPNGIPVAVKMLERSKGEGQEFINEVATIGRIHHVNIVRLLGFCSERSTRALIYEFLPNESLERYIFDREECKGADKPALSMEKLLDIVIGIARGIEYLHQGCQQRILHFDIKPHNILLDHEFKPKISDFGLAKLCSKEQSIVTMTAARGTMGYIAPEMYSRNFGTVSYKSDIYSFGMLVLEMVGGRKNFDPEIGKQSEIYYPEWIYDRLVHQQDFGLAMKVNGREEETAKKLAVVALWCIQWSPMDRPSMSRVLQMLNGSLESLEMPPTPFVSSSVVRQAI
ncbi:rust resistance kinase Lr10-like [Canna indica]|uniref:Rust resistance kinase Lr10-like n=1 Tax=Canna indica TaxID=4628 RepID=A0AAQ3JZY2_9LILI|nr:rust resistance kinase Lr10-like [Canna indica]